MQSPDTRVGIFERYLLAAAISRTGTAVSSVALPLTAVTVLHASAFQVSLIAAAEYAAWIVIGLPAGVVVARFPLRGVQVTMDAVRALAIATIPLVWWAGHLDVAVLIGVALVIGFANVLFDVGNATFLPTIVSRDKLEARNSVTSAVEAATQLGGPSLGGVLVQLLGAVPALAVDAVSYLLSGTLLRTLPSTRSPSLTNGQSMSKLILAGWRYVRSHPLIGPCTLAATMINFLCGALMALTPLYLVRVLGSPAGLVGVLIASEGLGTLIGAAITPRVSARLGTARTLLIAGTFGGLLVLLIPAGTGPVGMVVFAVGNAGFGAGVVVQSITMRTYRQIETPTELLSRVVATVRFVSWGAIPVGAISAGIIATVVGTRSALWILCASAMLTPAMLSLSQVGRRRDLIDLRGALPNETPRATA